MRSVVPTLIVLFLFASACSSSQPAEKKREPLTEPAAQTEGSADAASDEASSDAEDRSLAADDIDRALLESASKSPEKIARGEELYSATCSACHGAQAQGMIGPNLTDEYWLHGGDLLSIYETIYHGVPDRGCPTWGAGQYPLEDIVAMVAFIDSVRGSDPDKPKSPQGEKYDGQ